MKLHQLRYLVEISRNNLNITKAAEELCTSQSGISKQIKLLEEELGLTIFSRKGRNLVSLTSVGQEILEHAVFVLEKTANITQIARQYNNQQGTLAIATTHTQARYVLPFVVERFARDYPRISLNLQQGTPSDVAEQVLRGDVDVAIATEALEHRKELITLPCYRWARCVIVKHNHPLLDIDYLTLKNIVEYPIITYARGFTGRYKLDEAFVTSGLKPNIVLTAVDADVIKTYVRLGMGIGIIANMAFNAEMDKDLVALDASHLFGTSTTFIAFKQDKYIRNYIYRFIEMFAPHLNEAVVNEVAELKDVKERKQLFDHFVIPLY